MSRAFVLVMLAGCAFDRAGVAADDVVPDADPNLPDADPNAPPIDADPGAPDAMPAPPCVTWNALNVTDPCAPGLGTPGTISLGAGRNRYDTDTGVLTAPAGGTTTPPSALITQTNGPEARALNLTGLSIPAGTTLVAEGSRPLIIIVHGSASIDGTIDASATRDDVSNVSTPGAGGDDNNECVDGEGTDGSDATGVGGAGGGGGGSFGADGGDGKDGNGAGSANGGAKGSPEGTSTIVPLRGGCPGGDGGNTLTAVGDDGGPRGSGGGAVEITARGVISMTGTIAANGTGGAAPGLVNAGAGGAGSGGAILLDGELVSIAVTAKLCANGGGGGEGGQTGVVASEDGEHGACVETPRAQGGELHADGGNGGDGGAQVGPSGTNGTNGASGAAGGGGGAGVGRIRTRGRSSLLLDTGSIISPDATQS